MSEVRRDLQVQAKSAGLSADFGEYVSNQIQWIFCSDLTTEFKDFYDYESRRLV